MERRDHLSILEALEAKVPFPPAEVFCEDRPVSLRNKLSVVALSGALGVLLSAAGCAAFMPQAGLPDWAMHVRPARVVPDRSPTEVAAQLQAELSAKSQGAPGGHLAPEQIGAIALRELEQGHHTDAALWLAIASYRYHEEVLQLAHDAPAGARYVSTKRGMDAYVALVEQEMKQYTRFDFLGALDVVNARIYQRSEVQAGLQEQLIALGKTSAIERESFRDAFMQMHPGTATPEPSRYPALVAAFRYRLRADAAADPRDEHPGLYLSRTPIAELQRDAVLVPTTHFDPWLCTRVAAAFPALRPTIVAQLASSRSQVRSNAAAILGLAPSEATRAALEGRLAVETHPSVKLVLAFALSLHGVTAQAAAVAAALPSCAGAACTLAVSLARWLPLAAEAELEQAPLARIVADPKVEPRAHLLAALILRDIGRQKPLTPATVEALITAARHPTEHDDELALEVAYEAIGNAEALSRADVVARLEGRDKKAPTAQQDRLYPGPLLARLSEVALVEDLPLLGRMMGRYGDTDGPAFETLKMAILAGTLRVPGEQADARLVNWFNAHESLRVPIALALLQRPSVSRAQFDRLVSKFPDARLRLVTKALTQAPDTRATLLTYLRVDGRIQDMYAAAELAGLVGDPAARAYLQVLLQYQDGKYYPSDALVRHAAMTSLLRLALAATKPAAVNPSAPPSRRPLATETGPHLVEGVVDERFVAGEAEDRVGLAGGEQLVDARGAEPGEIGTERGCGQRRGIGPPLIEQLQRQGVRVGVACGHLARVAPAGDVDLARLQAGPGPALPVPPQRRERAGQVRIADEGRGDQVGAPITKSAVGGVDAVSVAVLDPQGGVEPGLDGVLEEIVVTAISGAHRRQQTPEANVGQRPRARRDHGDEALDAGRSRRRGRRRRQVGHPRGHLHLLREDRRAPFDLVVSDVAHDNQGGCAHVVDPSQPGVDVGTRDLLQIVAADDARVGVIAEQRPAERPLGRRGRTVLRGRHRREQALQSFAGGPVLDRGRRLREQQRERIRELLGQELHPVERHPARRAPPREDVEPDRAVGLGPRA